MTRALAQTVMLICCLVALLACRDEDFENAKVHKCRMEEISAQLAKQPGDAALQAQLTETSEMLRNVVDGSPNPERLRSKLAGYRCP